LRQADTLSLASIALKSKELTSQAIAGNIDPDLLKNGSFTISNLGSLDIEHFTPIINPPQTGILGVNTIMTQVRMDKNQGVVFYQAMGLSLTYDHRALDGAQASRFLKDLKLYLEAFPDQIEQDPVGLK
jgi:pyruvate dehydrogenase E2 component (dihydrolipoamide acetyltransferase)